MRNGPATPPPRVIVRHPEQLREEVDLMEKRLESFGFDGDCAYEKALVRYYERELDLRRAMLNDEERV